MRILWVKVGGLWPLNSGGRLRSFNILSELSRHHQVSVLTTHTPDEDAGELRRRLPHCERVISVPFAALKWRSPKFPVALIRSWFSPLSIDLWKNRVPALRREVRDLLDSGDMDLCVADFLHAVPNVPHDRNVPVLFFEHNVEYLIWKRLCLMQKRPWMRALLEVEWRKMRRYEAHACRKANLTVAVSPQDRDLLKESAPNARICDVPTGVDIDYFAPNEGAEAPNGLVFTGSMDWYPNEDAIRFFIADVLPLIRRSLPKIGVTVVGRGPSRILYEEAERAGVKVTGRVADVRPYIDKAAVYIVPLRLGGGTRLKIFEALAMGKAVVSTSVGAEGLPLRSGEHYLQADGADAFASAVVALAGNAERRQALGDAGRKLVRERYAWPQVAREFGKLCETARS
ncbi:MAG: glycosyltransferase family 4 protein [Gammaproteobacteria bacterium]